MDPSREEVVTRLKFLALIQEGEKVDTRALSLQPMSLYTSLYRYVTGMTRNHTLAMVSDLLHTALRMANESSQPWETADLLRNIESSLKGVRSLKVTYANDRIFVCRLDTLEESVRQMLTRSSPHTPSESC